MNYKIPVFLCITAIFNASLMADGFKIHNELPFAMTVTYTQMYKRFATNFDKEISVKDGKTAEIGIIHQPDTKYYNFSFRPTNDADKDKKFAVYGIKPGEKWTPEEWKEIKPEWGIWDIYLKPAK